MEDLTYNIPGFGGYSAIKNRKDTMASSMQNFMIRDTSLKVRNGSLAKIPASSNVVESFILLQTMSGAKHFIGAEGANLWKAKSDLSAWDTPALKADCSNAIFGSAVLLEKVYMGNGTNMLYYDGTTLSTMSNAPKFNTIINYKTRLWCNDLDDPTMVYYTDFDSNGVPTALTKDNYIKIPDDNGDTVKGFAKVLTHLVVANEFSTYAIYGSNTDDFNKVLIGQIGSVNSKSIATIGGRMYMLSYDGVYSYAGSGIDTVSFDLGELSDVVNTSRLANSCAVGYKNYYWLAISAKGSSTNDIILLYDTLTRKWCVIKLPFSINCFCLDGDDLYCGASDKKVYKLDIGTADDTTPITANWVSDPLNLGCPGRKKRIKVITIEISEISSGGTVNLYLKEDDGAYSSAFPYIIPTASPGETVSVKVKTGKFYNLTVKLETTANVTINNMSFGGKVKAKVK